MSDNDAVVGAIVKNQIPSEFWDLPTFDNAAILKDVHTIVVDRLQAESPDADTLELMMMERVCFLYIYLRALEANSEVKIDHAYRDALKLWVSMAADLRKTRLRAEETASIRMAIVSEVSRALKVAMKGMDPAAVNEVTGKLVSLVAV